MAFSYTVAEKTVFGNQRVHQGVLVADSTAGYVATGLSVITHISYAPKSQTSGVKMKINTLDSGTSTAGSLAVTGCTSGDEFYVTVFGR